MFDMWKDIVLSVGSVIGEAIFLNRLDEQKTKKYHDKLNISLQSLLGVFADTSLDCGDFYKLVNSSSFSQHIRMFFYTIYYDKSSTTSYQNCLVEYICATIPKLNILDVHEFVQSLSNLYETHLYNTIRDNPTIDALFQLLIKTNGDAYRRILANQDIILKYLHSQDATDALIEENTLKDYHDICHKEYGVIRFTGIAGAESRQTQNLNDFYIQNTFSFFLPIHSRYRNHADLNTLVELEKIFSFGNKVVILGGAGLGKTTTLNYIYCNYESLFQACALKIKIDLKEYANDIWSEKKDILWCITTDFFKKTRRQNYTFDELGNLLSDLLSKGQCLIIFDALDEISKQSVRNKVRDAIHNFSELYFLNRFIISSREAGYLRNQFDGSFLHFKINDFDDKQIKQYSHNWFSTNYIDNDFNEFWDKFTAEVTRARCRRLIRNPIILILALIIFDIEKNLPNKRVEFYKKCIDTFLSVREDRKAARELSEKTKNILVDDSVVPKIAYHKFKNTSDNPRYSFDETELRKAVFAAIEVPDPINWNTAVEEYSKYLIERTELIQEVDEDVLNFAHKTFYEYFLAVYYVKEYDLNGLINLLKKWIGDSNYDELARLIIEVIIQANNASQHHRIIDFLFTTIEQGIAEDSDTPEFSTFIILADLYSHNMLLPKYHSRYYSYILYHPRVVRTVEYRKRHEEAQVERITYDSSIVANMYCDAANDPKQLYKILDAAYYLDNDFRKLIVDKKPEKNHVQIVRLLRISHLQRKWNASYLPILEYFTNNADGLNASLSYPQVYLSVLNMMVQAQNFDAIEHLIPVCFGPNEYVWDYTRPNTLYLLINQSIQSCASLIVTLIALVDCAYLSTNSMFCFLLNQDTVRFSDFSDRTLSITRWLLYLINEVSSYEEFKSILTAKDLYDNKYENTLKRLYGDYIAREKQLDNDMLRKVLERLPDDRIIFPIEGLDFQQLSLSL